MDPNQFLDGTDQLAHVRPNLVNLVGHTANARFVLVLERLDRMTAVLKKEYS